MDEKSLVSLEEIRQNNYWMEVIGLTEREMNEIVFNRLYYPSMSHGTDGHNLRVLLVKVSDYVSALEEKGVLPKYSQSL